MNRFPSRFVTLVAVLFAFVGCQDAPLPSEPEGRTIPGVSADFVDASTTGAEGVRWQPPIVQEAEGLNNRDLKPFVVVCPKGKVQNDACGPDTDPDEDALATLETELTKLNKGDRYETPFDSGKFPLEVGDELRIFAFPAKPLAGELPAAWFDVELTDEDTKGNKKLTDEDEDGMLELKLGSTLPVAFRMSDAFFCSEDAIDDGFCFVGTFSNDEGGSGASENGFLALDVEPDFIPDELADEVDEVTFVMERVESPCLDGPDFPLEERDLCFRGATEPRMVNANGVELPFKANANGDSRVTTGMCFDESGLSEEVADQFQGWDADVIEIDGVPVKVTTPLREQDDPSLLDCTDFSLAALDASAPLRYAHAGWKALRDFFIPPAVAVTTGAGHSTLTFSNIGYARSMVVTDQSGDLAGAPGENVTVSVRVTRPPTTGHFDSDPSGSDYPDDTQQFDDGGDGPLDEAIAAATEGVNGVDLEITVSEGSAPSTVTTATVNNITGFGTFEVTLPQQLTTVIVTVSGPALGSPLEIPIEVVSIVATQDLVGPGNHHTCAVGPSDGVIHCWGENHFGQVGDGTTSTEVLSPTPVSGFLMGVSTSAHGDVADDVNDKAHSCLLTSAPGDIECWGINTVGQLGTTVQETCNFFDPSTEDFTGTEVPCSTVPVPIDDPTTGATAFDEVSVGVRHTCAAGADDFAYCWGANAGGEVGDGTNMNRTTPVRVQVEPDPLIDASTVDLADVASVTAGEIHSCALTNTGDAYCWGSNSNGQLGIGDGTITGSNTAVLVAGGHTFASLEAGNQHTCGITTAGELFCWGDNGFDQLGDGTTTDRTSPTLISTGPFDLVAPGGFHTCALASGDISCWGANFSGQLGTGDISPRSTPTPIVSPSVSWQFVAAGESHTCAVTVGDEVYCWGNNEDGQLGDGTTDSRDEPTLVTFPEPIG